MESGWATASRHDAGGLRREVRYFRSGPDLLYASSYRAIRPTVPLRVLVCPSWGMEGKQLLQWCHQVAHRVGELGGVGLVVHWPGFEDSEGDPGAVTFDRLVAACVHGTGSYSESESESESDAEAWSVVGIRFGASVAALAAAPLASPALALVEPAVDPEAYFADIERTGRQARLGAAVASGWAFAHPLPAGIRDPASGARVSAALDAFAGRAVVIRHQKPERPAPAGITVRTVPGSWQRGPFADHRTLLVTTQRWLRHAARHARVR